MADTDEESIGSAREADAAVLTVNTAMATLGQRLAGLGYPENAGLLERFQERFVQYRDLDKEILKLAVENTNLKAQRLLFGSVGQTANEFCRGLQALAAAAPAGAAGRIGNAALRAQLAIREIQVLEAPHIAEAEDSEMDRLEREMAARQALARQALASIERDTRPQSRAPLAAAKAAFDSFEALSRQLIELSRKNTNVRSLELATKQKPALTSACDASLAALQNALANQGFSGTR